MSVVFNNKLPIDGFAHALQYACEWAVDYEKKTKYVDGCMETTGHMLACWLVQECNWDCCPTADATQFIPWDALPKNHAGWVSFLHSLADQMTASTKKHP